MKMEKMLKVHAEIERENRISWERFIAEMKEERKKENVEENE